jgi:tRNA-dihydrouridine synthase
MKNMSVAKPFFVLAPMDDVTDTVFRQVVRDMAAPDLFFTEFVNVDGLMSPGRPNLLKKLRFAEKEGKVVAQLWGLDPDNFRAIAAQIADGSLARELGLPDGVNFAGVDLNMGCPAKSEVKNGACAALIRPESRPLAEQIIAATREGLMGSADLRMPLSVKTRTGFSAVDMTWFDFLLHQNLDMLTVHGRTRKQMSKVSADWELIGRVREMRDELGVHTLIVGNGDVMSREQGEALAAQYKLDGIMIGRGIFHDPYIFHQDGPGEWEGLNEATRINLYRKHVELFAATWKHGERPIHTLNNFCKMYIQGFDGASALRATAPQPQRPAASTKTAAASPVRDRYAKLTGEDLPDEVAESPAAVEALRKVAMASGPVNELGEPSDRFDRSGNRPVGRTKAERVKEVYALFGDELLKD